MNTQINKNIELIPVKYDEKEKFKKNAMTSFFKGLSDNFPANNNPLSLAPIPTLEEYDEWLYTKSNDIYWIYFQDVNVGGVILDINTKTNKNVVEILYINADMQGEGIGSKIWSEIECQYPNTKIWILITPYFEKRNISFYLKKCDFVITDIFKRSCYVDGMNKDFEFFCFEKFMSNNHSINPY